ncbi:MAG: hypothetical protein HYX61_05315 [Gammaproteobacteria bacterium]|jgi:hypothetical protein|nr:hypothetical protein [Gammaproteobacteria bacterium]
MQDKEEKAKTVSGSDESPITQYTKKGKGSLMLGAITQCTYSEYLKDLDPNVALQNLIEAGKKIKDGDLECLENVLIIQAHTLDMMFNNLACRASNRDYVSQTEAYMRLALKAQTQCRATIETLANIKNPPHVAFVKQANIGHNQQVNNNGTPVASRAGKIKNKQNQLLEEHHGERLDTGAQGSSIAADKELATVGEVDGA